VDALFGRPWWHWWVADITVIVFLVSTGMQHNVILESEARGLPTDEVLLPEELRRLGYSTHAIGKWHLGFSRTNYTPLARGFDSHYGFWNGYQDYYTHTVQASVRRAGGGIMLPPKMSLGSLRVKNT